MTRSAPHVAAPPRAKSGLKVLLYNALRATQWSDNLEAELCCRQRLALKPCLYCK